MSSWTASHQKPSEAVSAESKRDLLKIRESKKYQSIKNDLEQQDDTQIIEGTPSQEILRTPVSKSSGTFFEAQDMIYSDYSWAAGTSQPTELLPLHMPPGPASRRDVFEMKNSDWRAPRQV